MTQTIRSLGYSNSEPLTAPDQSSAGRTICKRFLAAMEKAFGNFIEMNGHGGGRGRGRKQGRLAKSQDVTVLWLGLFFPRGREKWVIDSRAAYIYLIYFISLAKNLQRKGRAGERTSFWISHRKARYIRDHSLFIVAIYAYSEIVPIDVPFEQGDTRHRLSMRTRISPTAPRSLTKEKKKKIRDAYRGKQ